jgi:hypothetical protein
MLTDKILKQAKVIKQKEKCPFVLIIKEKIVPLYNMEQKHFVEQNFIKRQNLRLFVSLLNHVLKTKETDYQKLKQLYVEQVEIID